MSLVEESGLTVEPYGYRIGTPREPARRGGHVAIEHDDAARISVALRNRGTIVDFRKPNVVRLAPIALYTTYQELWQVVQVLREIIDSGELAGIDTTSPVT
jgi:kynureninase